MQQGYTPLIAAPREYVEVDFARVPDAPALAGMPLPFRAPAAAAPFQRSASLLCLREPSSAPTSASRWSHTGSSMSVAAAPPEHAAPAEASSRSDPPPSRSVGKKSTPAARSGGELGLSASRIYDEWPERSSRGSSRRGHAGRDSHRRHGGRRSDRHERESRRPSHGASRSHHQSRTSGSRYERAQDSAHRHRSRSLGSSQLESDGASGSSAFSDSDLSSESGSAVSDPPRQHQHHKRRRADSRGRSPHSSSHRRPSSASAYSGGGQQMFPLPGATSNYFDQKMAVLLARYPGQPRLRLGPRQPHSPHSSLHSPQQRQRSPLSPAARAEASSSEFSRLLQQQPRQQRGGDGEEEEEEAAVEVDAREEDEGKFAASASVPVSAAALAHRLVARPLREALPTATQPPPLSSHGSSSQQQQLQQRRSVTPGRGGSQPRPRITPVSVSLRGGSSAAAESASSAAAPPLLTQVPAFPSGFGGPMPMAMTQLPASVGLTGATLPPNADAAATASYYFAMMQQLAMMAAAAMSSASVPGAGFSTAASSSVHPFAFPPPLKATDFTSTSHILQAGSVSTADADAATASGAGLDKGAELAAPAASLRQAAQPQRRQQPHTTGAADDDDDEDGAVEEEGIGGVEMPQQLLKHAGPGSSARGGDGSSDRLVEPRRRLTPLSPPSPGARSPAPSSPAASLPRSSSGRKPMRRLPTSAAAVLGVMMMSSPMSSPLPEAGRGAAGIKRGSGGGASSMGATPRRQRLVSPLEASGGEEAVEAERKTREMREMRLPWEDALPEEEEAEEEDHEYAECAGGICEDVAEAGDDAAAAASHPLPSSSSRLIGVAAEAAVPPGVAGLLPPATGAADSVAEGTEAAAGASFAAAPAMGDAGVPPSSPLDTARGGGGGGGGGAGSGSSSKRSSVVGGAANAQRPRSASRPRQQQSPLRSAGAPGTHPFPAGPRPLAPTARRIVTPAGTMVACSLRGAATGEAPSAMEASVPSPSSSAASPSSSAPLRVSSRCRVPVLRAWMGERLVAREDGNTLLVVAVAEPPPAPTAARSGSPARGAVSTATAAVAASTTSRRRAEAALYSAAAQELRGRSAH